MKHARTALVTLGILALALGIGWKLISRPETAPAPLQETEAPASAGLDEKSPSAKPPAQPVKRAEDEALTESFEALAERALRDLPSKADLRKLTTEEVHHTPAILMKAASDLGEVAEALDQRLKQAEGDSAATDKALSDGISFYRQCMSGKERPESVRALCYSHYRELREKSGNPETQDEAAGVPPNVRSLAEFLAGR